jgi:hypothetical protein
MKKATLLSLFVALTICCTAGVPPVTPNAAFNKMLENYYEDQLHFFPMNATATGDQRFDDQLPADFTDGFESALKNNILSYDSQLKKFNRDSLNDNDKISMMHYDTLSILIW